MVGVVVPVLVLVAALCVDIGMQRVARSDMQSVADVAALDMARVLATTAPGTAAWRDALRHSLERNAGTVGRPPASPGADWVCTARLCARATAGWVDTDNVFRAGPPSAGAAYNGVQVESAAVVGFAFTDGGGGAVRTAVARSESSACFDLGSYAAALSTADSTLLAPLGELLGLDASLGLVSYQGLAAAEVTLAGIAAAPTIGTPQALLDPSGVTVGTLIGATIFALQHGDHVSSTRATAAVDALNLLRTTPALGIDLGRRIPIGDLVGVDVGDTAALGAELDVLDLIGGALALSNGTHLLDSSHAVMVPGIGALEVGLTAIQGTRRMCGRPDDPGRIAEQSQLTANVDADVPVPIDAAAAGVVGSSSLAVSGHVRISGGVGNARAQLVSAPSPPRCGSGTQADPDTYHVRVWGGLLGIRATATLTVDGAATVAPLDGLVASVEVKFHDLRVLAGAGNSGTSTASQTLTVRVPQNASNASPPGVPVPTGQPVQALTPPALDTSPLSGSVEVRTRLVGGLLPGPWARVDLDDPYVQRVLAGVMAPLDTAVLQPAVDAVNGLLVPLSRLLGIRVPGADVYGVARPACDQPRLAG